MFYALQIMITLCILSGLVRSTRLLPHLFRLRYTPRPSRRTFESPPIFSSLECRLLTPWNSAPGQRRPHSQHNLGEHGVILPAIHALHPTLHLLGNTNIPSSLPLLSSQCTSTHIPLIPHFLTIFLPSALRERGTNVSIVTGGGLTTELEQQPQQAGFCFPRVPTIRTRQSRLGRLPLNQTAVNWLLDQFGESNSTVLLYIPPRIRY